jgi:hypothetical protein
VNQSFESSSDLISRVSQLSKPLQLVPVPIFQSPSCKNLVTPQAHLFLTFSFPSSQLAFALWLLNPSFLFLSSLIHGYSFGSAQYKSRLPKPSICGAIAFHPRLALIIQSDTPSFSGY